jgi:iron(III) transport system substrate-binding protein
MIKKDALREGLMSADQATQFASRREFFRQAAAAGLFLSTSLYSGRSQADESLLWYSASGSQPDELWSQMFHARTGNPVEFFRMGGVKLTERIEQEAKTKQTRASVIDISIPGLMSHWARSGILEKYDSPEAQHYPIEFRLPGYWVPVNVLTLSMAYNADYIKPQDAPKTWEDLLDPKWKGKMTMSDALYSGGAAHWFWALRQAYGKSFMERLAKQDILIRNGSGDTVDTITSGERPLAAMLLDYYVYPAIKKGANLMVVQPESGIPASYEIIGVPAGAPNLKLGQAFVDFALSREAQSAWQAKEDMMSMRDDIDPVEAVHGRRPFKQLKLLKSTIKDVEQSFAEQRASLDEWIDLFK